MSKGLFLVATPIGNLDDITFRAVQILKDVDIVAAEDTRKTGNLLKKYDIKANSFRSYHDHNEQKASADLLQELENGNSVALVSNAGTPGISDPGFRLVKAAIEKGIEVTPIPGPCALITALIKSGLPVHRFVFVGFPPKKPGKLRNYLAKEEDQEGTLLFYESPHRLSKFFEAALEVLGDRPAAVCRELTKIHEECVRGTLSEFLEVYKDKSTKGEIVIAIEGKNK